MAGARGQKGQSIVIGAFAMVAMVGVAGLAVDGGRSYVNRRSLQASADAAADTAMRMILQNYHDAVNARTQTFTDCYIHDKVAELTSAAKVSTASSGIDSATIQYTDASGNVVAANAPNGNNNTSPACPGAPASSGLNICTTPTQTNCVAGLAATPQFNQITYLLRIKGVNQSTDKATATSVFTLGGPPTGYFSPYVVWHEACGGDASPEDPSGSTGPDTDPLVAGDQVIFSDNHWSKPGSGTPTSCASGKNSASSSFKGGISTAPNFNVYRYGTSVDCSDDTGPPVIGTTIAVGNCLGDLSGGNGSQPTAPNPGDIVFMPMIDGISGQGGNYHIHVIGFVSEQVNADGVSATIRFVCNALLSTSTVCVPPASALTVSSGFLH